MPTRLSRPGPLALAARVGLLVVFATALFVAGAVLGVALFGPTGPDAPTLPFGLGGPADAVLVAPATAEPSESTGGPASTAANESASTAANESTEPGRPLPPPD